MVLLNLNLKFSEKLQFFLNVVIVGFALQIKQEKIIKFVIISEKM